eukprot:scaffold362631_cov32-Prasinocladus_malaysianus.AAC.1
MGTRALTINATSRHEYVTRTTPQAFSGEHHSKSMHDGSAPIVPRIAPFDLGEAMLRPNFVCHITLCRARLLTNTLQD